MKKTTETTVFNASNDAESVYSPVFWIIIALIMSSFGLVMFVMAPGSSKPASLYALSALSFSLAFVHFVHGRIQIIMRGFIFSAILVFVLWCFFGMVAVSDKEPEQLILPLWVLAAIYLVIKVVPFAVIKIIQQKWRFSKHRFETIHIDTVGISRVCGSIKEQIDWDDIQEIKIITTDKGPYEEDFFYVLSGSESNICTISHESAQKHELVKHLSSRFKDLDYESMYKAVGSVNNDSFLVWQRDRAVK